MATLNASTYQSLSDAVTRYCNEVDQKAEEAREKLSTSGSSQARIYEAKLKEAQEGGGPLIQAEAAALEVMEEDVINNVLQAYQHWKESCGTIEGLRLKAKADIRAAETPAEMYSIVKQFKEVLNVV